MRSAQILAASPDPWPRPSRPWVTRQTWQRLLFAHWPLPPNALAGLIPSGLTLETYDGRAWVGVVPFTMSNVRPRLLPAVPWLSFFSEINVRTYVTAQGKPGVWFFSLDAGNPIAVTLARTFFHLPYFTAAFQVTAQGDTTRYASQRARRPTHHACFSATYRPTGPVFHAAPGSLEHFLTERYCLYAVNQRGEILRGDIRHPPWDLQPAEAEITKNTLAAAAGIALPAVPPLLHYAHRQDMVAWWPERVG